MSVLSVSLKMKSETSCNTWMLLAHSYFWASFLACLIFGISNSSILMAAITLIRTGIAKLWKQCILQGGRRNCSLGALPINPACHMHSEMKTKPRNLFGWKQLPSEIMCKEPSLLFLPWDADVNLIHIEITFIFGLAVWWRCSHEINNDSALTFNFVPIELLNQVLKPIEFSFLPLKSYSKCLTTEKWPLISCSAVLFTCLLQSSAIVRTPILPILIEFNQ